MRFHDDIDKQMFESELTSDGLDEAGFLKKRKALISKLKNFRKKQDQKGNWRKNRWKIMKGIKRFHKSTAGKAFHRQLGRLIATKDFAGLKYGEAQELVVPLSSMLTHAFVEHEFYMTTSEHVEYELFTDEIYKDILEVLKCIQSSVECDLSEHEEFIYRMVDTSQIVKALAADCELSEDDVDAVWSEAKKITKTKHKLSDSDDGYLKAAISYLKSTLNNKTAK